MGQTRSSQDSSKPKNTNSAEEMSEAERQEALAFLEDPQMFDRIASDAHTLGLVGEEVSLTLTFLIATSRLLDQPMSGIIKAESSSGKSYLAKTILSLMPPEDFIDVSRATDAALYYLPQKSLVRKVVLIAEDVGVSDDGAGLAIRLLQSEGSLKLLVPVRNLISDEYVTKLIQVDGPCSFIITTSRGSLKTDNETRAWTLTIDLTPYATGRIHTYQRWLRTWEALDVEQQRAAVRRRHQNAQRLLKPVKVVIPFAELIEYPVEVLRSRRDHERTLSLITSIALLRQFQKPIIEQGGRMIVEAEVFDYRIAHWIVSEVLGPTLDDLSPRARQTLGFVKEMLISWSERETSGIDRPINDIEFTRKDLREFCRWSTGSIHSAVKELASAEYLTVAEGGSQGKQYKYLLSHHGDVDQPRIKGLLTPEQLEEKLQVFKNSGDYGKH